LGRFDFLGGNLQACADLFDFLGRNLQECDDLCRTKRQNSQILRQWKLGKEEEKQKKDIHFGGNLLA
jgi:hypothetical protein